MQGCGQGICFASNPDVTYANFGYTEYIGTLQPHHIYIITYIDCTYHTLYHTIPSIHY